MKFYDHREIKFANYLHFFFVGIQLPYFGYKKLKICTSYFSKILDMGFDIILITYIKNKYNYNEENNLLKVHINNR